MNSEQKIALQQIWAMSSEVKRLQKSAAAKRKMANSAKRRAMYLTVMLMGMAIGRNRTVWTLPRSSVFWETYDVTNDQNFEEDFRVPREIFNFLVRRLQRYLSRKNTSYRDAVPIEKRIAMSLFTLGSCAEYRTIATLFGVGKSTLCEIFLDFCYAVVEEFEKEFLNYYPPTAQKIFEITNGFERVWGFPQTYGAVDGCHVEIVVPIDSKTDYYNYKGWYSTILLASVDYRYRFTYANIGSPGKNNDSYIFERSALKRQHRENPIFYNMGKEIGNAIVPVQLIGDSAFRLSSYLMKPYPQAELTPQQLNFNYILSRSRRVVESAFGQYKNRFRRIGKGLEVDIGHVCTVLRAACILHNILNEHTDMYNIDACEANEPPERRIPINLNDINDNAGQLFRDEIARSLMEL